MKAISYTESCCLDFARGYYRDFLRYYVPDLSIMIQISEFKEIRDKLWVSSCKELSPTAEDVKEIDVDKEWVDDCIQIMEAQKTLKNLQLKVFKGKPDGISEKEESEIVLAECEKALANFELDKAAELYKNYKVRDGFEVRFFIDIINSFITKGHREIALNFFKSYSSDRYLYMLFTSDVFDSIINEEVVIDFLNTNDFSHTKDKIRKDLAMINPERLKFFDDFVGRHFP